LDFLFCSFLLYQLLCKSWTGQWWRLIRFRQFLRIILFRMILKCRYFCLAILRFKFEFLKRKSRFFQKTSAVISLLEVISLIEIFKIKKVYSLPGNLWPIINAPWFSPECFLFDILSSFPSYPDNSSFFNLSYIYYEYLCWNYVDLWHNVFSFYVRRPDNLGIGKIGWRITRGVFFILWSFEES